MFNSSKGMQKFKNSGPQQVQKVVDLAGMSSTGRNLANLKALKNQHKLKDIVELNSSRPVSTRREPQSDAAGGETEYQNKKFLEQQYSVQYPTEVSAEQ